MSWCRAVLWGAVWLLVRAAVGVAVFRSLWELGGQAQAAAWVTVTVLAVPAVSWAAGRRRTGQPASDG
jgi:hypothetical protein